MTNQGSGLASAYGGEHPSWGGRLFQGKLVCLIAPEPDRAAAVLSRWTHDTEFMQMLSSTLVRPLAPGQIKKDYKPDDSRASFRFLIQVRATQQRIGFVRLGPVNWSHGNATILLGIADATERGKGYGAEALRLTLGFAFDELNLHRVGASVPGYNRGAISFLRQAGFVVEANRREAIHWFGERWDVVLLGLLLKEWRASYGSRNQ